MTSLQVLLLWNSSHQNYDALDQYVISIQPAPVFGVCSTGKCIFNVEYATIPGLDFNTNYTISIMASACHILSDVLSTHVLIEQHCM